MFQNCYKEFTQLLHNKYLTRFVSVYNIYKYIRDIKDIRYIDIIYIIYIIINNNNN